MKSLLPERCLTGSLLFRVTLNVTYSVWPSVTSLNKQYLLHLHVSICSFLSSILSTSVVTPSFVSLAPQTQQLALCSAHSTCSINICRIHVRFRAKTLARLGWTSPGVAFQSHTEGEDRKVRRHPSPRVHSTPSFGPKSLLLETRTIRESSSVKGKSLRSQM